MEAAPGEGRFARWQFAPEAGVLGLTEDQLKAMGDEFPAGELRERVAKAPVSFDFRLQLAEAGDNLTDPVLNARAAPYAISLGRRLGEASKK